MIKSKFIINKNEDKSLFNDSHMKYTQPQEAAQALHRLIKAKAKARDIYTNKKSIVVNNEVINSLL